MQCQWTYYMPSLHAIFFCRKNFRVVLKYMATQFFSISQYNFNTEHKHLIYAPNKNRNHYCFCNSIFWQSLKIMYYEYIFYRILLITTEYLKVISNPPVKHGKVCLSGQHYSCEIYFLISASNWDHLQMDILKRSWRESGIKIEKKDKLRVVRKKKSVKPILR